jgi:hypothetical protein
MSIPPPPPPDNDDGDMTATMAFLIFLVGRMAAWPRRTGMPPRSGHRPCPMHLGVRSMTRVASRRVESVNCLLRQTASGRLSLLPCRSLPPSLPSARPRMPSVQSSRCGCSTNRRRSSLADRKTMAHDALVAARGRLLQPSRAHGPHVSRESPRRHDDQTSGNRRGVVERANRPRTRDGRMDDDTPRPLIIRATRGDRMARPPLTASSQRADCGRKISYAVDCLVIDHC